MSSSNILDGFTMLRSTATRPFVTVTPKLLTFSKLAISDLDYASFVHVFFNEQEQSFAIRACKQDVDAIPFVRSQKPGSNRHAVARWGDRSVISPIVGMIDPTLFGKGSVRIIGETYKEERIIVFHARDISLVPRATS